MVSLICRKISCKRYRKLLILLSSAFFLVLLLIIFHKQLFSMLFTVMLLALGALSTQFKRLTGNLNLGIEFIPFATIIFFYTHGVMFGIIASLLMMVVACLLVGTLNFWIFLSTGIFALTGIISLFLPLSIFSIASAGIVLAIIFNVLTLIVFTIFGYDIVNDLTYFFGSIIFNFILFKYFSGIIFQVIA